MLQLNHHSCVVAIFCCFHFHSFSGFFRKKIKLHSSLRISFVFLVRAERNGGVFTEGFYSWRWWKIGRNNLGIDLITKTKTSSKQQKYFPCLFYFSVFVVVETGKRWCLVDGRIRAPCTIWISYTWQVSRQTKCMTLMRKKHTMAITRRKWKAAKNNNHGYQHNALALFNKLDKIAEQMCSIAA